MLPSDIYAVLQWWSVILLLGIGFLPLTFLLFEKFFDKGYIFSKVIGLFITGYLVFILGVFKILMFTPITIFVAFAIAVVAQMLLVPHKWKILYNLKTYWAIFLIEEALFLLVLFAWAYVHSFAPDIHGLEKYMDFGFINSFLRSEYLPAKDMWFTPFTINYYYFGHLLTAMLTKMSGLSSAITFNLMLSSIVAFCFVQVFSIGANLYVQLAQNPVIKKMKLVGAGLLSAALVTFAGNLHIFYSFFKPYKTDTPVPFWQLQFTPMDFPNSYWYPNATRFIYNTIHEFPIYSWVVADLHGHVLDIPFVLLIIGLLFALVLKHTSTTEEAEKKIHNTFQVHPLMLMLLGLLLACMYMTNAWDGAIYLLLVGLVLFYIHGAKAPLYRKALMKEEEPEVKVLKKSSDSTKKERRFEAWHFALLRDYILAFLVVITSFFAFSTPYNLNFDPFVSGIGVLCAPDFLTNMGKLGPFLFEVDHCQKSPPWQLFTLYGFFYFFVVLFGIAIVRAKEHKVTDIFVLLLVILSTFLIIIPEFFYVKDIYPAHYRANTMFKLVFQAFIMLGISTGYIIVRSFVLMNFSNLTALKRLGMVFYTMITITLVYFVLTYPYLAIKAYYGDFKNYQGLNGVTYLQKIYPADYDAIDWLNDNVEGQPVILEAQSDSYTDFGRVSSNTGLPTVLGWTVHEWLWRGSYSIPEPRINDVKNLYETSDVSIATSLVKKYNVEYVFIGTLEYQKYPSLDESKFNQLGEVVFQKDNTKIYKIK